MGCILIEISWLVYSLVWIKMISYKIITCNCYFDRCLAEINENPQLLNIDEENLKKFLCLSDKWSSKDAWHQENRYHFYDDRTFHPCHKCIFFSKFGRYNFVHYVLNSHWRTINFYQPKTCLQKLKIDFGCGGLRDFYYSCQFNLCFNSCQFNLCFNIISNGLNCLYTTSVIKND